MEGQAAPSTVTASGTYNVVDLARDRPMYPEASGVCRLPEVLHEAAGGRNSGRSDNGLLYLDSRLLCSQLNSVAFWSVSIKHTLLALRLSSLRMVH